MSLSPKVVRRLEELAFEETHQTANPKEIKTIRDKVFTYINNLEGDNAYKKQAYFKKYSEMILEYRGEKR